METGDLQVWDLVKSTVSAAVQLKGVMCTSRNCVKEGVYLGEGLVLEWEQGFWEHSQRSATGVRKAACGSHHHGGY